MIDRRRVSVQWFSGTILTGVCGAALMGGAVFASLDGETNFATVPERVENTLRGAIGAIGDKLANRKSDRLPPAGESNASRQIIRSAPRPASATARSCACVRIVRVSANLSLARLGIRRQRPAVQRAEAAGRRPAPTACRPTSSRAPSPTPRSPT